jgi:DNA-binding CsgD family transcriptional regulator
MKSENETFNYSNAYQEKIRNTINPVLISDEKQTDHNLALNNILPPYSECLIDHSGRQFVCFHKNCLEHENCFKKEVSEGDHDFQTLLFHPEDKALLCGQIFPDILRYIEPLPIVELPKYRFSFNHRYIRKDGSISQFLQEGTLTFSEDKSLPVLSLKVFTEIGDIKTDESIILTIFCYSADQGYQKVLTKVYGNNRNALLSHREIEIINLCLEGLSSKMIADKLNLSIHTVKNHKRNCMEKTLTHNIAELIHLCIRSHWL